jgi:hypothetical protein
MTATTASAAPVLPDAAATRRLDPLAPGLGVGLPQNVDGLGVRGPQPESGHRTHRDFPGERAGVVPEQVDAVLGHLSFG